MNNDGRKGQSRKKLFFKFFPESWLWGSSRSELKPDERSVWVDFLCLAASNGGDIEIPKRRQLARQLMISEKLLNKSLNNFIKFEKVVVGSHSGKEVIRIANWDKYQGEYLKNTYKKDLKHDARFTDRGEERRGEEIRGEEITRDVEDPLPPPTSAVSSGGSEDSLGGGEPPSTDGHDCAAVGEIVGMLEKAGIPALAELRDGFTGLARHAVALNGEEDAPGVVMDTLGLLQDHPEWLVLPDGEDFTKRLVAGFRGVVDRDFIDHDKHNPDRVAFLSVLKSCPGYPFDEFSDSSYFSWAESEFPKVDLVAKATKKIAYWKQNPNVLRDKGGDYVHAQLTKWFEEDFKNQKIGDYRGKNN